MLMDRNSFIFPLLASLLFMVVLSAGCAPLIDTAAWVIRYDLDTPAEVEDLCRAAQAAEIDALLVQVRGRADAFYQSSMVPRAETLANAPDSFDPLQAVIDSCQGIAIHAWLNVYYLWSAEPLPSDPRHPAHPDRNWVLHDAEGRSVAGYTELERSLGWIEGVYADPASPEYKKLFAEVIRELAEKYPVAGIHLDFVRYPGYQYGQTGLLGRAFQEKWGIDPRYLTRQLHDLELADWLAGRQEPADRLLTTANILWSEMRAEQVTDLIRLTRNSARQYGRPSLKISAAIFPDALSAYFDKGQDWLGWADNGLVDALYPMAYFGQRERVERQLAGFRELQKSNPRIRIWAGLGAYIKEPAEIAREAIHARKNGYDGIALFSLGHLLKKPGQLDPYARALTMPAFYSAPSPRPLTPLRAPADCPLPRENSSLQLLSRVFSGPMAMEDVPQEKIQSIFQERLAELEHSRTILQQVLLRLNHREINAPPWAQMRGVFRYVHPYDTPQRREEQRQTCEDARGRMEAGEGMEKIARELSQGGSRSLGGNLGRRFLDTTLPDDLLLAALEPGGVTPVIEADNGYWCYLIEEKGPAELLPLSRLPWAAQRIIFRQALAELLRDGGSKKIIATGSGDDRW
jgi:uncharacterized lipoprotein YddW (UPF0748 family)